MYEVGFFIASASQMRKLRHTEFDKLPEITEPIRGTTAGCSKQTDLLLSLRLLMLAVSQPLRLYTFLYFMIFQGLQPHRGDI